MTAPSSARTAGHPSTSPAMWTTVTVGQLALRALARYPDRVAFSGTTGDLTYAAAADLIGRFQRVLATRGLGRGDRVALLSGNSAEAWCACIAAQASGMVTSWLHPMGSLESHLDQLADLDAAACIVDIGRHGARASELTESTDGIGVWALGSASPFDMPDVLAEAREADATTATDVARPDEIAMINYTGGTTGKPKGAVRRHDRYIVQTHLGTVTDFEIPFGARYLAVAPITHVAGTKILPVLSKGGTIYLRDGFDAESTLRVIADERISMTLMVPTMIYSMLDHPRVGQYDLSSLEVLLYGASDVSASHHRGHRPLWSRVRSALRSDRVLSDHRAWTPRPWRQHPANDLRCPGLDSADCDSRCRRSPGATGRARRALCPWPRRDERVLATA